MTDPDKPSGVVVSSPASDVVADWRADVDVHPAADLFRLLDGEDLAALAEDIRENGQRDPITRTTDGAILDGRNRYRACLAAGVEPKFETYDGDEPWQFVISRNLHRRHLTDTERAMIAGDIAGRAQGEYARPGANRPAGRFAPPPTQSEAAEMFHVSARSVRRARGVHADGSPALVASAQAGEIPLTTAERWAKAMSVAQQDQAVAAVRSGLDLTEAERCITPEPAAPPKIVKRPAAERASQIRELAERHHTTRQIASALGIGTQRIWQLARDHDITVAADAVVGRTRRRIDAARVIGETVSSLEGTAMALALLEPDQVRDVDPDDAAAWSSSLADSIRTLTRLRKELDRVRA